MNLVEQVRSLQVSARVFAAADDAEPYTHVFNCQNEKRVLWRDQQCFLCVHCLGTLLKAHTKWVFPALSKYRKKEFFNFFFLCVWVTAVDFVKLWLNHMVGCFDGLWCPTKRTSSGHR